MDDKSANRKWKPKLLSSSLPLEYEVARALVASGFSVQGEHSYHRLSEGLVKEFSVDVQAIKRMAAPPTAGLGCALDLLVECKYRTRQVVWWFVPDPNGIDYPSQYEIIRGVDAFSRWFLREASWLTTQWNIPICYKGVEIDVSTGAVESAELKHGLFQLQFAVPSLLKSRIEAPVTSYGVIENLPFLFVPILVTNAPLYVARPNLTSALVEASDELAAVSLETKLLLVRLQPGQDFYAQATAQLAGLTNVVSRAGIRDAEDHRKAQGVHASMLPSALAARLDRDGTEIIELANVEYILVCHLSYFPSLLSSVTQIADRVSAAATQELPEHFKW
jgi:hypothetical protein